MTPNCANAISKQRLGREEIPRQGKDLRNSRKLRKVVAIYKLNKLVLSKKYMSLKSRGSKEASQSKSSYSLLIASSYSVTN